MTVVVNLRNEEEEKELYAFSDSRRYDYQTEAEDILLTDAQQKEILRRDQAFNEGTTSARSWDDIKKDLENIYR